MLKSLETMREEIVKKTTKSFEMTAAGLQLNDSDPQATMAPELTFNLKKQMTVLKFLVWESTRLFLCTLKI